MHRFTLVEESVSVGVGETSITVGVDEEVIGVSHNLGVSFESFDSLENASESHFSDGTIHYTQSEISISESQISDLDKYTQLEVDNLLNDKTDNSVFNSHIDDSSIHFEQTDIVINESQISDLDKYTQLEVDNLLGGKVDSSVFDGHVGDEDIHFGDAPSDSNQYVRQDGGWSLVDVQDVSWSNLSGDQSLIDISGFTNDSGFITDYDVTQGDVTQYESVIDHNSLANYSVDEHRVIDDSSTSTTGLWSSSKIDAELGSVSADPAGSNGEIQFNSSGSFGSSPNFSWDDSNNALTIKNSDPNSPSFLAQKSFTSAGQSFFRFGATHVTDGFVQLSENASRNSVFLPGIQLRGEGRTGAGGIIQGQIADNEDNQIDRFAALIFQADRVPNPGDEGGNLASVDNANVFMVRNRGTPIFVGKADGDLYIPDNGSFGIGTKNPSSTLHVNGSGFFDQNLGVGKSNPEFKLDVKGGVASTGDEAGVNFGVLSDRDDFPRGGFQLVSDGDANNYGFVISNDRPTDDRQELFFELINSEFYSEDTQRFAFGVGDNQHYLRSRRDTGSPAGAMIGIGFGHSNPNNNVLTVTPNDRVGILTNNPSRKLDVNGASIFRDNIEITADGEGLTLNSPDGTKYKVTVNDDGNLVTTQV